MMSASTRFTFQNESDVNYEDQMKVRSFAARHLKTSIGKDELIFDFSKSKTVCRILLKVILSA